MLRAQALLPFLKDHKVSEARQNRSQKTRVLQKLLEDRNKDRNKFTTQTAPLKFHSILLSLFSNMGWKKQDEANNRDSPSAAAVGGAFLGTILSGRKVSAALVTFTSEQHLE